MTASINAFHETPARRLAAPLAELAKPRAPFVMVMAPGGDQAPVGKLGRFATAPPETGFRAILTGLLQ
jgi:hypothetical protein